MIDWADLVLAPCIGVFGEAIVYQSADGLVIAVDGVFDEAYRPVDPLAIEGIAPMHVTTEKSCLGVRLADFPVPPEQGDLLSARGVQYYVQEVQVDGKGGAKLVLNLQKGQR